jgi:hypothetical protein
VVARPEAAALAVAEALGAPGPAARGQEARPAQRQGARVDEAAAQAEKAVAQVPSARVERRAPALVARAA